MVAQLSSGLCMALELVTVDESKDTHAEFRKFCGPMDPVSFYNLVLVVIILIK